MEPQKKYRGRIVVMSENIKEIVGREGNREVCETTIKNLIYVVRRQQVMLDSDLARLYQVETGERFEEYRFYESILRAVLSGNSGG